MGHRHSEASLLFLRAASRGPPIVSLVLYLVFRHDSSCDQVNGLSLGVNILFAFYFSLSVLEPLLRRENSIRSLYGWKKTEFEFFTPPQWGPSIKHN